MDKSQERLLYRSGFNIRLIYDMDGHALELRFEFGDDAIVFKNEDVVNGLEQVYNVLEKSNNQQAFYLKNRLKTNPPL